MQQPEEKLIAVLKKNSVDFTASLPCEKIKTLLEMVGGSFPHVPLTREEEGVGICAGAALAGKRPALFVQSSGLGNMINALLSLTQFYELPLAIFVSRRGVYKEKIEAQLPMGQRLGGILSGAGIGWTEINTANDLAKVEQELPEVYSKNLVHAFLMSPAVWEGSQCGTTEKQGGIRNSRALRASALVNAGDRSECGSETAKAGADSSLRTPHSSLPQLTRYDLIKIIAPYLENNVVVSNLGWPSKELYAIKHQPSNFYMLGSMGMANAYRPGYRAFDEEESFRARRRREPLDESRHARNSSRTRAEKPDHPRHRQRRLRVHGKSAHSCRKLRRPGAGGTRVRDQEYSEGFGRERNQRSDETATVRIYLHSHSGGAGEQGRAEHSGSPPGNQEAGAGVLAGLIKQTVSRLLRCCRKSSRHHSLAVTISRSLSLNSILHLLFSRFTTTPLPKVS